jgi:hypothetical protein
MMEAAFLLVILEEALAHGNIRVLMEMLKAALIVILKVALTSWKRWRQLSPHGNIRSSSHFMVL